MQAYGFELFRGLVVQQTDTVCGLLYIGYTKGSR